MAPHWNALSATEQAHYRLMAVDAWKRAGGRIGEAEQILRSQGSPFASDKFIRRAVQEAGLTLSPVPPPINFVDPTVKPPETPPPDPILKERERLDRVRGLRQERELIRDIAGEQAFRAYLSNLVRKVIEPLEPPPWQPPPQPSHGASVETLLLNFSDWHAYEVVKRERTQGLNEYNAAVFARRVKRVVDETIKIKQRLEAGGGWRLPRMVVSCNGDFVSGTIHETERPRRATVG